ncbi:MAG: hypothetical protein J3Q66DRAFT_129270 [Benniella sp.]|nr:MAG: hypothetical protein J3Q66DRAFT_129270 [Benniella sp.]
MLYQVPQSQLQAWLHHAECRWKREDQSAPFCAKLIAMPEGGQDVTAQQVHLLESGACRAFVHGLEDEYQDVWNAAINSSCDLCLQNTEFSVFALDYMVDMFMDKIDCAPERTDKALQDWQQVPYGSRQLVAKNSTPLAQIKRCQKHG